MRPIPKGYTLQKGDVVVLHATLKYGVEKDDKTLYLNIPGYHGTVNTALEHIQGLHRHNIEVGSQVLLCDDTGIVFKDIYAVIAIHGELAWIKTGTSGNAVVSISTLLPNIEPPDAPAEPLQVPQDMTDQDSTAPA